MDYLKDSILALFADSQPESVLRAWVKNDFSCLNKISENELAHMLYKKNMRNTSLDQMHIVAQTVRSLWMTDRHEEMRAHFSSIPSIFNIILHFTCETLSLTGDGKPQCNFENVLRWHELASELGEDGMVTSYMAASDLYSKLAERKSFCWQPILPVDSSELNNFLNDKPLCDLHNHLQGSSLNFDLNWLCLMNYAVKLNWSTILKKTRLSDKKDAIHDLVLKAACIRLYLWNYYTKKTRSIDGRAMRDALRCIDKTTEISLSKKILHRIEELIPSTYKFRACDANGRVNPSIPPIFVDYAISAECVSWEDRMRGDFIYNVLSGERYLMYRIFRDIYNHKTGFESQAALFYAYVLIKNQIRRDLVQVNDGIGFGNFDEYERCKKLFIYENSAYQGLIEQLAVSTTMTQGAKKRYLETRIAPSNTETIAEQIAAIDKRIHNAIFTNQKVTEDWRYYFIFHFIKTKSSPEEVANSLLCRNYACREQVKVAAEKIADYMLKKVSAPKRIVGIDAANSEMNCRPEVFAQAFRCLRHTPIVIYNKCLQKIGTRSLGITYHVGEDNYDLVDGLRAVDELIRFMDYRSGDRMGHCLVLGANVGLYYGKRHYTLMMPRIVLLDNIVWLLYNMDRYRCGTSSLKLYLKFLYEDLFYKVYPRRSLPWLTTYYNSWLLRGDDPELYRCLSYQRIFTNPRRWNSFAYTKGIRYSFARLNIEAYRLNQSYHFDGKAKVRGDVSEVVKIPQNLREDWIDAVNKIRLAYLRKVEDKQYCIECNPTSNRKIGDFERYDEHPAMQFFYFSEIPDNVETHISTSFNTDDKGVFSTSLEREYALMAMALKKKKSKWNMIIQWLKDIRDNGIHQAFLCPLDSETEYEG